MSEAWSNPKDVSYDGVHLEIHGIDIREQMRACLTAYDGPEPNLDLIGRELGLASRKLVSNIQRTNQGQDLGTNYKQQYYQTMGAEFVGGFLFGANIGGFDTTMIYECLQYESRA